MLENEKEDKERGRPKRRVVGGGEASRSAEREGEERESRKL